MNIHILIIAIAVGLSGSIAAAGAPTNWVPLRLELPRSPFFNGPVPLSSTNLEAPRRGPRDVVLVPPGTTNLARGLAVTTSGGEPLMGEWPQITDGEKELADTNVVEIAPGTQWVQIDLGRRAAIHAVAVWHYYGQEVRIYRDVVVQISDDPDFAKGVTTVFNNDIDNTSGRGAGTDKEYIETNEGKLIDARGVTGRYVRLYSNGNTANKLNHYIEVEVCGEAAK